MQTLWELYQDQLYIYMICWNVELIKLAEHGQNKRAQNDVPGVITSIF